MELTTYCLRYLELANIMSKPEMMQHLNLKDCLRNKVRLVDEIAKKLDCDLERLKNIFYSLDIAIDFKVPLERDENLTLYAHNLDYFLASKKAFRFLTGESDVIVTKYGTIKEI